MMPFPLLTAYSNTWAPIGPVGSQMVGMGIGSTGAPIQAPPPSAPSSIGQSFSAVGAVAGAITTAIGGYAAAQQRKHELKSQASSLEFQAQMSQLNARAAENDAQEIMRAGNMQIGLLGMRYAQEKAALRTSTGARGIKSDVGSAAEVQASVSLAREIDALTLRSETVRAAGNARMRGVQASSDATMARVGAANSRASAGTINPALEAHTSLLGSASRAADYWMHSRRYGRRY